MERHDSSSVLNLLYLIDTFTLLPSTHLGRTLLFVLPLLPTLWYHLRRNKFYQDSSSISVDFSVPPNITCLRLAQLLPYHRWQYHIYFDSFLSNIILFATLRGLGIGACGTARKNQVPAELQEYDQDNPKPEWNDLASVSHNNVLSVR